LSVVGRALRAPARALARLTGLAWVPDARETVPVVSGSADARVLAPGEPFSLLSWNIQFSAGRTRHFFFDGGPDVWVPSAEVTAVLEGLRADTRGYDLLLLQEVDRGSDRTGRIDELGALVSDAAAWASACYHRSRWVPVPPRRPLGRVDMHLAVVSRLALSAAERRALPPLAEPWWRRAFNLRRAILHVDVPLADGRSLAVAVTHLSAFSRGDGTLPRQVAVLRAWMEAQETAGRPFVLAGDLNLLPPDDDPSRLPDAEQYADAAPPIAALASRWRSVLPLDRPADPALWTYQPYGRTADRTLDYVFVSDDVEVLDAQVLPTSLSDHLPIRAHLCVRSR
jgi:endonuclease/exonuclease/phosphatase family metal-dependent hydrolase